MAPEIAFVKDALRQWQRGQRLDLFLLHGEGIARSVATWLELEQLP